MKTYEKTITITPLSDRICATYDVLANPDMNGCTFAKRGPRGTYLCGIYTEDCLDSEYVDIDDEGYFYHTEIHRCSTCKQEND